MRGIGEPQRQIGDPGFGVSGAPVALPIVIGPIEIGKMHSQHTSEIGLTNLPVQGLGRRRSGPQDGQQRQRRQGNEAADHPAASARRPESTLTMPCLPATTISVTVRATSSRSR